MVWSTDGAVSVVCFFIHALFIDAIPCPNRCLCPEVDVVLCNGTTFTSVPENLPRSLRSLSISHSPIRKLIKGNFRRYSRLESLRLDRNLIETIDKYAFRGLRRLRLLSVQHNQHLKSFGRHSFGDIRSRNRLEMYLQSNGVEQIERMAFAQNTNIRKLDLRGNPVRRLRHFALSGLSQVDFLYLPEGIERIDRECFSNSSRVHLLQLDSANLNVTGLLPHTFDGLQHVKSLVIKRSNLGEIKPRAFAGLETVNYVRLIDCQMERIRRDAFKEMENVGSLELVDNQIHLIDAHAFNISVIRFEGNKIYCGCQNMWLLAEQVTPLTVLTNNYCSSPMAFENRALIDIDKQYIQNCSVNGALLWSSMAPIVTIDPSTTVLTFILLLLVGNLSP